MGVDEMSDQNLDIFPCWISQSWHLLEVFTHMRQVLQSCVLAYTVKPVLSGHSKIGFKTNYRTKNWFSRPIIT